MSSWATFGDRSLAPPLKETVYRSFVILNFRFGRSRGERRCWALVCSCLRSVQIKRGSRRNRIPPCGFRISAALVLWLLGVPGGLNRDRHGIRWRCPLGPAIARSLGFLMSPTRALRVTLWEPCSSFPHSTIHSDNYIIAPYYPLGRSLDGIKSSS